MKAKLYKKINPNQITITHDKRLEIRLNKYISDSGISSRRGADRLISDGLITVNDEKAVLGMKITKDDVVKYKGKIISLISNKVYLLLNKPEGIVSSTNTQYKNSITEFMDYPENIFMVGRLDKNSTGLILLTNDGDIVNKILRVEYGHEKEYLVTVNKPVSSTFIKEMESGVSIYNPVRHNYQTTLKTKLEKVDNFTFKIIIKQGLNRQIRRMADSLGYKVTALKRIRIMHLKIDDLPVGYYRYLTNDELNTLNNLINKNKSNNE